MPNVENRENRARAGLALRVGGAVGVGLGLGIAGIAAPTVASGEQPILIVRYGETPSAQSYNGIELAADSVPNIRIESRQQAADRFGVDSYSRNPDNWRINSKGGATLKPDPDGFVHRVRTAGAVFEGWVRVKRNGIDAVVFVANPNDVNRLDLQSGTAWLFSPANREAGFHQVREQVIARERIQQPGVLVEPLCDPDPETHDFVPVVPIASRQAAADRYGADNYSKNPDNWFINQIGGATLRPDPDGSVHRVENAGSIWEGWLKVNRVSGNDALAFVSAANIQHIDIYGGTVWRPRQGEKRKLFWQVYRQLKAREAEEQPDIVVVPICN